MTIQNIGLFQAMSAKIDYLGQRQSIISQNVANADTPGYRPQDLKDVDFGAMIGKSDQAGGAASVSIETTQTGHLGAGAAPAANKLQLQKRTYEVAPAGNAVILEEQLVKASETQMNYNMVMNLYQKNLNLMRVAIGQQPR